MKYLGRLIFAAVALVATAASAFGQGAVLQGGSWTPGHFPQYVGTGSSQAIVIDGGGAGGGPVGANASELGIVARGTGTPPYVGQGTGPFGTLGCFYDAPTTNATGYHYLCFSPNAQGGGLLAYGAGGAASALPMSFNVNGISYPFPFVTGGIIGPGTTVVNDAACWNNTIGTLLKDCGVPLAGPGTSTVNDVAVWNNTSGTALKDVPFITLCGSNIFTSGASGCVPASGGGTTNFLRADGTFAAPASFTLPSGVSANVLNTQTLSYTIQTTDCGKTIQMGTGATGLLALTLPSVSGFAATCVVNFFNGDTAREKTLSGFPSTILPTLWPTQFGQVSIINGAWDVSINPRKWRPSNAIVFNVSTNGIDGPGCALGTGSTACATGQYAMNLVCQNIDPSLLSSTAPQITIQYATGSYTQTINSFCDPGPLPWVGSMQGGWLKIAGNTNLIGVTLGCGTGGTCFSSVHSTAGWWIEGFVTSGNNANSLVSDAGSHIYVGTNSFGTTGANATDVNAAYGSLVEFEANFTTTGSKGTFVSANQSGSRIIFKPITVTITGTSYTTFYQAEYGASITAPGANVTYAGTATVGSNGCWVTGNAGGLETDGGQTALTTACGSAGHAVTSPGWAN